MLEEDSSGRVSYEIKIDTHDAYKYITTQQPEENSEKIVNIK